MRGCMKTAERNKMKFFVTGACGQLEHDMMAELKKRGIEAAGSDIFEKVSTEAGKIIAGASTYIPLDITDKDAVERTLLEIEPDAVIHCAAWTAVDLAEEADRRKQVWDINVAGTRHLADACKMLSCKMTYISTDYVFDGQGVDPWKPECRRYHPLNVYGQTKLEGERAVADTLDKYFIVRISWAFGPRGNNFVKTMIRAGRTHDRVCVVNDQIGTPTYTPDLARLLADMNETDKYGYYHASNEGGYISWYDFCCNIYEQCGLDAEVIPVSSKEYGRTGAVRPANSRLDKSKLVKAGFCPLPDWRDAVERYLRDAEGQHFGI